MDNKMKAAESGCSAKLCFDRKAVEYNTTMKEIKRCDSVQWLLSDSINCDLSKSTGEMLSSWCKRGTRKTTIDGETNFCHPDVLRQLLHAKSMFDKASKSQMRLARQKSNPFETVNKSIFINRAAVKLANLDALLDFHLTNPKDGNGKSLVDDVFYFSDICAGPGGFSEYILWRKEGWQAKGFGFTLRGPDDFTLNKSTVASCEAFQAYYGNHKDGDLLKPDNIKSLCDFVSKRTEGNGVHLLTADGGFRVDDHNIQEIESKQLILCQFVAVLGLVREGGTCVVKMFDVFTPFTAGLVYLMHKCFKQIAIVKPDASRPANSERYLIGKFKKANTGNIRKYLFAINRQMTNNQDVDVLELVPINVMKEDINFFNYLCDSNNTIGRNQIDSLLKIAAFYNNKQLVEPMQEQMRYECLTAWKLPREKPIRNEKSFNGTVLLNRQDRDLVLQPSINSVKPTVSGRLSPKLVKPTIKPTLNPVMPTQKRVNQSHIVQAGAPDIHMDVDQQGNVDRPILHCGKRACTDSLVKLLQPKRQNIGECELLTHLVIETIPQQEQEVLLPPLPSEQVQVTESHQVNCLPMEENPNVAEPSTLMTIDSNGSESDCDGDIIGLLEPENQNAIDSISTTVFQRRKCLRHYDSAYDETLLPGMEQKALKMSDINSDAMNVDSCFALWQQECQQLGFSPPLPLAKFNSIDWNHASKYSNEDLISGTLMTLDEMQAVKRRWDIPYCHPGPMMDKQSGTSGWYYPDQILQRLQLKGKRGFHYIVRWVGYEDDFNTIESKNVLNDTAVLDLFELTEKGFATASRAGVSIVRRSERLIQIKRNAALDKPETKQMNALDRMLQVEIDTGRYLSTIGFIHPKTAADAMTLQFKFYEEQFLPYLNRLNTPGFVMGEKVLGSVFSNIGHAEELKQFEAKCTLNPINIRKFIYDGLAAAGKTAAAKESHTHVSFIVMNQHDPTQKSTDKQMDMHMCVYTVRKESSQTKNALFFDPAPQCLSRPIPRYLERLKKPKIKTLTKRYGKESRNEDCFYQCLSYILELHSGKIAFDQV